MKVHLSQTGEPCSESKRGRTQRQEMRRQSALLKWKIEVLHREFERRKAVLQLKTAEVAAAKAWLKIIPLELTKEKAEATHMIEVKESNFDPQKLKLQQYE